MPEQCLILISLLDLYKCKNWGLCIITFVFINEFSLLNIIMILKIIIRRL